MLPTPPDLKLPMFRTLKDALELPFANSGRLLIAMLLFSLVCLPQYLSMQMSEINVSSLFRFYAVSSVLWAVCTPIMQFLAFSAADVDLRKYNLSELTIISALSLGFRRLPTLVGLCLFL